LEAAISFDLANCDRSQSFGEIRTASIVGDVQEQFRRVSLTSCRVVIGDNSTMESLERLQGLHADLVAFSETRFANIDRLWQELEESLQDFRQLLAKSTAATSDRDAYNNGLAPVLSPEDSHSNLRAQEKLVLPTRNSPSTTNSSISAAPLRRP
jgi:hypothetical protein